MTEYKVRIIYDWIRAEKELVTRDAVTQRPTAGMVTIMFSNGTIVRLGKGGNKVTYPDLCNNCIPPKRHR